ncbi:LysR family transcriptional regulator [Solirubrobacter soli]|uniref:LysR family transcriptional regulator n=1 Tax=Solirubrobacter soli TaxID=363832 RepID=UPI00041F9A23|nr:LysR family transcriptional regulator [Solirubrobacter soli]
MELRQFEAFVAAAEEGGITRAADRLHVVQSAVSASLRRLEAELGTPLFERHARGVQLTDAGRALLPHARAALGAAEAAREAVDAVRGGLRGVVRLGIMQSQSSRVSVPGILREFRDLHPGVELRVGHGSGGSVEMAGQVAEGLLDIAFVALREPPAGVELTPLAAESIALICPREHRLASAPSVELADLVGEPIAETPPGWGTRIISERAFAAAGLERTPAFEINDIQTILDLVRNGLAVALLPAAFVLDDDSLAAIPVRGADMTFEIVLARPSGRRLGAAAEALGELIVSRSRAGRR